MSTTKSPFTKSFPKAFQKATRGIGDSGISLPMSGVLFRAVHPNSDAVPFANEAAEFLDESASWMGFILPTSCFPSVGGIGIYFSDSETPIAVSPESIVADPITNVLAVYYNLTRGLTIYALDTPIDILNKARQYYGLSPLE